MLEISRRTDPLRRPWLRAAIAAAALLASAAGNVRGEETCAGKPAGTGCWMEVAGRRGCHVWNVSLQAGAATATWSGGCAGGRAQGTGTLTWSWDGKQSTGTGRLVDGKRHGNWVELNEHGTASEGRYLGGEEHGGWTIRSADGSVQEGSYRNGKRHGHWTIREGNLVVLEGSYIDGNEDGDWIARSADGTVHVFSFANGRLLRSR